MSRNLCHIFLSVLLAGCFGDTVRAESPESGWKLHVIDDTSQGADGTKLADLNGNGRLDIVTGWEEGNEIRVYLQPEQADIRQPWPKVTVGEVNSPEDAIFLDVNQDGRLDVVSFTEGKEQTVFVHLAPQQTDQLLNPHAWKTIPVTESVQATRWMFGLPLPSAAGKPVQMLAGSKNPSGRLGYFTWADPTDSAGARWQQIGPADWIMSLLWQDLDGDGHEDLIYSDRFGKHRGCWVRRNPGDETPIELWPEFPLGGQGREVMFLSTADLNGNGKPDLLCPDKNAGILLLFNDSTPGNIQFRTQLIPQPPETGTGKCVVAADVDLNGQIDLLVTCENAAKKHGVYWLKLPDWKRPEEYTLTTISGRERGIKYDLIVLIDLDGDGDLDLLTCEERDNLGVIWYENPAR